jgi:hypothetical protein
MSVALTVGRLRELIAGLPDDTRVRPDWAGDPPADHEPGVRIDGASVGDEEGTKELLIHVGLFYLDDVDDDEEEYAEESSTSISYGPKHDVTASAGDADKHRYIAHGTDANGEFRLEVNAANPTDAFLEVALARPGDVNITHLVDAENNDVLGLVNREEL